MQLGLGPCNQGKISFSVRKKTWVILLFGPYCRSSYFCITNHVAGCSANTIPQFFIVLAIGTYFCTHVEYVLSSCVQSPAADIISLVCRIGLSVFSLVALFWFIRCLICFSRPSVACFCMSYCFSAFLPDEAVMDTSCNGLSFCVFSQLSSLFWPLVWKQLYCSDYSECFQLLALAGQ